MKDGLWGTSSDKDWAQGDDGPAQTRSVFEPTGSGKGDGLAFFFLFGLNRYRSTDQSMVGLERDAIKDDVELLCRAGYRVVVEARATREHLRSILSGEAEAPPAGIYWSAHGQPDGSVEASDGDKIHPSQLEDLAVSSTLKLFVMSACYSASRSRTWRAALGGHPLVVGWGRPVTIDRAVDFLTPSDECDTDFDDLVQRYLVRGEELPEDAAKVEDRAAWHQGDTAKIVPIVSSLSEVLGGQHRVEDDLVEVRVRSQQGRLQVVRLCTVTSEQPFFEGRELFAAESVIGELSGVVNLQNILSGAAAPGLTRLVIVDGPADLPVVLVQGFFPLKGARIEQLAGVVQEVALRADLIERRIFGADNG